MMKPSTTLTTSALLANIIALGVGTSSAFAANIRSTYTIDVGTIPAVDRVVVDFSTNETSGIIDENDLTDWSIKLLNGTDLVYRDDIVVDGNVQKIGGVTRTLSGIDFSFSLDTQQYTGMFDNDKNSVQLGSLDVTYRILGNNSSVFFNRFSGGTDAPSGIGSNLSTFDLDNTATTPEPSMILGLLVVGSLGLFAGKRK